MSNLTYKNSRHEDGPRHYLAGEPVSCGSRLDVLTPLGWLVGRFEIDHRGMAAPDGALVEDGKVPMFYARLPVEQHGEYAMGAAGETMCFELSARHVLRWPARLERGRAAQLAAPAPAIARWGHCRECDNPAAPQARLCVECEIEKQRRSHGAPLEA